MLDLMSPSSFFFPPKTPELVDIPTADKAMKIDFMSQAKKQSSRLNGMPPFEK